MRTGVKWLSCLLSVVLGHSALAQSTALIKLTGPDGQEILINPKQIVSLRPPRGPDHVGPNIHCIVHTTDGKFIGVVESCETFIHVVPQGQKP